MGNKTNTITVTSDLGKAITVKAKLIMGLVVIGKYEDIERLVKIIYWGVEKKYDVEATKIEDGKYCLSFGFLSQPGPLSKNGKAFYDEIYKIIYDDFTTTVTVESGNKNVDVGNYNTGIIDIADIEQFPESVPFRENTVGTQQGKLIHELAEQHYKQKNKFPDWIRTRKETKVYYDKSHGHGLEVEEKVDGLKRIPFKKESNEYIVGKYKKQTKDNAIGYNTEYYNPTTGTVYIEQALLKHDINSPRMVIKLLSPVKIQ